MDKREKVIKGLQCCARESVGDCVNCPYGDMDFNCDIKMMNDALELLKAQEPKQVHVTADLIYRKVGECPNCRKVINSVDYPNYCGVCGQAVKWDG